MIFSNAFVEWAASEAFRRARPRVLVARFGMRSKPKPFTSIAVFENQNRVSTVPNADDPENSAIDAAILSNYVWLAAQRYPEYEHSLCICLSEYLCSGLIVAPREVELKTHSGPYSADELYQLAVSWLANQF